jgi:hypothetical protein
MDKQQVLHQAEELGQGRALTTQEIRALALMAVIAGAWGACVGLLLFNGYWLWSDHDLSLASLGLPALAGLVVGSGAVLVVGGKEIIDGLRSWREAKTFAPGPGLPQPKTGPAHDPILIRAGNRTGYLDRADEPLALPSPERQRLELTPKTVSVILREIIERHGGQWSRARIMGVKVEGQSVPRRIYEDLTDALTRAGILAERSQGGYEFSVDVKTLDDLAPFFPGLPGLTGPAGGPAGGPEGGGLRADRAIGGADRARARWLEQQEEVSGGGHGP